MLYLLAHFKDQSYMCVSFYPIIKLYELLYLIYPNVFTFSFIYTIPIIVDKIFIKDPDIKNIFQTFFYVRLLTLKLVLGFSKFDLVT